MRPIHLAVAILALGSVVHAQVGNDHCINAAFLQEGIPTPGSTVGATSGPDPLGTCGGMGNDVWYVLVPGCTGPETVTLCDAATTYDTVVTVWNGQNGCGALTSIACNDDYCGLKSQVTFQAVAFNIYYISVGGFSGGTGSFVINVNPGGGSGMNLAWTNLGPGTIGYAITGGPSNGSFLTAISLNQGAYPNGWFFGIDILQPELTLALTFGFPFSGTFDQCGSMAFGPIGGAPSGLNVFAVSFGFSAGSPVPTVTSNPATMTIP